MLVLFLTSFPAFPKWLSVGVKGGVPLANAFETATSRDLRYFSDTKRYTVGPVVELRFPLGLGVEFDALYTRLNFGSEEPGIVTETTANAWHFPLLLKVRAPGFVRPYLSVGPSFRRLGDVRQTVTDVAAGRFSDVTPSELRNRFSPGFVIGGGFELGDRTRLAPEIRYTRWTSDSFRVPPVLRSNPNQFDFLIGLHF
jgi:hypothetical protein